MLRSITLFFMLLVPSLLWGGEAAHTSLPEGRIVFDCPTQDFAESLAETSYQLLRAHSAIRLLSNVRAFPMLVQSHLCGAAGIEDIPSNMWDPSSIPARVSSYGDRVVLEIRVLPLTGGRTFVALAYDAGRLFEAARAEARAQEEKLAHEY